MTRLSTGSNGLRLEGVDLAAIARQYGTPCYVYSRAALEAAYHAYTDTLQSYGLRDRSLVCYAIKANSNLAVLNVFARLGAGFDIVSGGELARVLAAGGDPKKIVFSGVGKQAPEMAAALKVGIHCFNIESASELELLSQVASQLGLTAPISLRVNPDVDPKTHPYISTGLKSSKFGIAYTEARALYRRAATLPGIAVRGIDCHIGSQILDPAPAAEAVAKLLVLVDELAADGIVIEHIDVGGGLGITYRSDECAPATADYLRPMLGMLASRPEKLLFEPGRSLVGNAGLLLTQVSVLKPGAEKNFAIVDAAMNDLMRPALYDAWHDIVKVAETPVGADETSASKTTALQGGRAKDALLAVADDETTSTKTTDETTAQQEGAGQNPARFAADALQGGRAQDALFAVADDDTPSIKHSYEIVGPVCESGDWLGHDRHLALAEGDLLAILSAGAYGMAMSSNYNTRPRAAEVMVDGEQAHLIRQREEVTQLFALESILGS